MEKSLIFVGLIKPMPASFRKKMQGGWSKTQEIKVFRLKGFAKMNSIYEEAIKSLSKVHGDVSVSPQETLENLRGLRDELDMPIESVESDIRRNEKLWRNQSNIHWVRCASSSHSTHSRFLVEPGSGTKITTEPNSKSPKPKLNGVFDFCALLLATGECFENYCHWRKRKNLEKNLM